MKLKREAAVKYPNKGWITIISRDDPWVGWDSESKSVKLRVLGVDDLYSSNSAYDYDLYLSLDEIQKIFKAVTDVLGAEVESDDEVELDFEVESDDEVEFVE